MKFKFLEGRNDSNSSEQEKIEALKREEAEGLRRFFREIITPEILEENFIRWQAHLENLLREKYPEEGDRRLILRLATEYVARVPVRHGTSYKSLRSSQLPNISSDFMVRGLGHYGEGVGNTTSFDRQHELDHFVYGFLGTETGYRRKGWDTQVYLKNSILHDEQTLVALEDFGDTIHRLVIQEYKGNATHAGPTEAFDVHLKQLWKGNDFVQLFPLMLAYAYDNPEDFDLQKPFPLDFVPDGLPRLIKINDYSVESDFPRFEVRIPQTVVPEDIMAFCVDESAITEKHLEKNVIVVPTILSGKERQEFVKERISALQDS